MKQIFDVRFADGGDVGLYSTGKKALAGAAAALVQNHFTPSRSEVAIRLAQLKAGELEVTLTALDARDVHDVSKIITIRRRIIR